MITVTIETIEFGMPVLITNKTFEDLTHALQWANDKAEIYYHEKGYVNILIEETEEEE